MAAENHSAVTEFILGGLTNRPELQLPLFFLFLGIYSVTMVGNLGVITLICLNAHLHTPMYYFLSSLSFVDLCYSSVITPKMLANFVSEKNIISYAGCMSQLYFFLVFVIAECYMLTVMAYDRYVAICRPLLYNIIMSQGVCSLLVAGVYAIGFIGAVAHTGSIASLIFCADNLINHFMCDIPPLLELACNRFYVHELVVFIVVTTVMGIVTVTISISYALILSSILRIHSTEGRSKAFSTCSSHIIVVFLFFGSGAFVYLRPPSVLPLDQGKVSSLFYTVVVPMLNPLIYSLRNKDVKAALRKTLGKINFLRKE
ncbi:unnamed protein product [Rangifer tarandus platyrhynchus]|uniref:Olfactory receptor n=2 Tax=Rangifer tarandus platyrhynchus TaxID=3082113 RepID=A0ABN8Z2I7_RANTA|nr:unnamed protein product [Rangifer tarandus platyrhynchus]